MKRFAPVFVGLFLIVLILMIFFVAAQSPEYVRQSADQVEIKEMLRSLDRIDSLMTQHIRRGHNGPLPEDMTNGH